MSDGDRVVAGPSNSAPAKGGEIASIENWPKNEAGSVNWEVVFEHPETGLLRFIAHADTPAMLRSTASVIIAQLFRRPGDETESSRLAKQLIDIISDDMKAEQIKTTGDVITSVLRRIKEERQAKAAEYEKEQAEKRRKGDEASKSVGGSVERRKPSNTSQESKQAKHKGGAKKAFALVAVVFLIAAIGSGWFYYQRQSSGSDVAKQQKPTKRKNVVYCDFPKVTVVLKNSPTSSVKPVVHTAIIQIAAEFDDVTVLPICKTAQPRVLDSMQGLLRNTTFEELQGLEGTERLRVNIVKIVNRDIGFKEAEAVLFKQILIQ